MRFQGSLRLALLAMLVVLFCTLSADQAHAFEDDSLTPVTHALEPGDVTSLGVTGVFGPDERTQVSATTSTPYSMVAFIMAEWPDGTVSTCSGFMIGARTVGTAGHCVYEPRGLGWAKRVLVAPGANGSAKPYGTVWATSISTVTGWSQRREVASDIAAVTLPADLGDRTGLFQMRAYGDDALTTGTFEIAGYPGDKVSASMWRSVGRLDRTDARLLYFRLDVTHGNSGGPIWEQTPTGQFVVGLVEGGSSSTNVGVRFSPPVIDRFRSWVAGNTDTPATNPAQVPTLATAPKTLAASPASLTASAGQVAYALISIGATRGGGDLTVSTTGGSLVADGYLSPTSCASGTRGCIGTRGNATTRITLPEAGNDIQSVALTLVGTVSRNTTVTVTASQASGETWRVTIPVQLMGESVSNAPTSPQPGSAGTGRITGGAVPAGGGVGLFVFGGGTTAQMVAASGCPANTAVFWAAEGGAFLTYIPGTAISAVNAAWDAKFATGIPGGTALLGRCR